MKADKRCLTEFFKFGQYSLLIFFVFEFIKDIKLGQKHFVRTRFAVPDKTDIGVVDYSGIEVIAVCIRSVGKQIFKLLCGHTQSIFL